MELKDIIRTRRQELGLTLEEVARHVGVNAATVLRWENGTIQNLRRDKIAKLSEVLQVTPAYLMGWEETENELTKNGLSLNEIAFELDMSVDRLREILVANDVQSVEVTTKIIRVAQCLLNYEKRNLSEGVDSLLTSKGFVIKRTENCVYILDNDEGASHKISLADFNDLEKAISDYAVFLTDNLIRGNTKGQ